MRNSLPFFRSSVEVLARRSTPRYYGREAANFAGAVIGGANRLRFQPIGR